MSAQAKLEALLSRVQRNRTAERVVPYDEAVTTPGNVMSPMKPSPLEAALGATPRAAQKHANAAAHSAAAPPAAKPTPVAKPVRPAPAPARPAVATPVTKPTAGVRAAPSLDGAGPAEATTPIRIDVPVLDASAPVISASAAAVVSVAPKTFGELFARSIALRPRR